MKSTGQRGSVLVAGSINMDIVATTAVIPLPGETVVGQELHYYPGGKGANQAIAASRAGVTTRMIGNVGKDSFGPGLKDFLAAQNIDVGSVGVVESSTGTALIVVQENGENSIVVVPGANGLTDVDNVKNVSYEGVAVGVAQFEIPVATIECFFAECRAHGVITMLNTAPAIGDVGGTFALADILVLNETELNTYAGCSLTEDTAHEEIFEYARQLRMFPEQVVVVTLGRHGALALNGDHQIRTPGVQVSAVDTTGAGDCFVGYLAAAIAAGAEIADGLRLAGQAAAMSVQKPGAGPSMPFIAEIESPPVPDRH